MNLAYERKIPEYRPGAHPTTGGGSPYWPAYEGSVAVHTVAQMSGISVKLVSEILFELYWGTKNGRITDTRLAFPWTYRLNEEILTKQPAGTDKDKNEHWWDFDVMDLLTWGAILGVVGVGAYALSAMVSTTRTIASVLR